MSGMLSEMFISRVAGRVGVRFLAAAAGVFRLEMGKCVDVIDIEHEGGGVGEADYP